MASQPGQHQAHPRHDRPAGTDRAIKFATVAAGVAVALVATIASYQHAHALVRSDGENGLTARLVPLTVDGMIAAWPAIALVGSYELLMMLIRHTRAPAMSTDTARAVGQ